MNGMNEPHDFKRGRRITRAALNKNNASQPTVLRAGPGMAMQTVGGNQYAFSASAHTGAQVPFISAVVVEEYADCLLCNQVVPLTYDVYSILGAIWVAKPLPFQRSRFDGVTIEYQDGQEIEYTYTENDERSAEDVATEASETQQLTPPYYVGEMLSAVLAATGLFDPVNALPMLYLDTTPGRAWARPEL